jgi:hypothetical protein
MSHDVEQVFRMWEVGNVERKEVEFAENWIIMARDRISDLKSASLPSVRAFCSTAKEQTYDEKR